MAARLFFGSAALVILALFSLAAGLAPSASGLGTHMQLGFPACRILSATGWPCPSCGLTTSFALAVRGRMLDSARVQPFGFVLFLTLAVLIPWLLYRTARPVPLTRVFDADRAMPVVKAGLLLYGAAWAYKSYIVLNP